MGLKVEGEKMENGLQKIAEINVTSSCSCGQNEKHIVYLENNSKRFFVYIFRPQKINNDLVFKQTPPIIFRKDEIAEFYETLKSFISNKEYTELMSFINQV